MLLQHKLSKDEYSYLSCFSHLSLRTFAILIIVLLLTTKAYAVQVTLSWDQNNESNLAGYKVYFGGSSRNYTSNTNVGNKTSYRAYGLEGGKRYFFAVRAYSSDGLESADSLEVVYDAVATQRILLDIAAKPTSLQATAISTSQIDLSWNASWDNTGLVGIPDFKIYRDGIQIATTADTTYQDTGLSPSTTYTYAVSAYDVMGNETVPSTSASATTSTANRAPEIAMISSITVNEGDAITITPTAKDPDGDALTFSYSGWMTSDTYTTAYNDAGVHVITVTVSDGELSDSQDVAIIVNDVDIAPPSIPTNLSATVISESQIELFWNGSTDDAGVTGYIIYRDGTLINTTTDTSYQDMGLSPTTLYTYTVSAYDATGNKSRQSLAASAATLDVVLTQITTIINKGDTWKYFKGYSNPGDGWSGLSFDDSAWDEGPTGIGSNDGNVDYATILSDMRHNYLTVYARKTFNILDASAITGMILMIDYDDGFVAYINGQEVARAHMPDGIPDYDTKAGSHEAGAMEIFDSSSYTNYLVSGTNVLTVEIHNSNIMNSDLSMIPELSIENKIGGGLIDISPPSIPANLSATVISESQIDLFWDESTDDAGVTGYIVYRDGTLVHTTTGTSYQDMALSPTTFYTYTVSAYDAAGNDSEQSLASSATTLDVASTYIASIISKGDKWKSFKGYSNPRTGWNGLSFDDSAWDVGPSGIGFNDGDDAAILSDMRHNYLTVYARKTFNIFDASAITGMIDPMFTTFFCKL